MKTVLIAEDEETTRRLLCEACRQRAYLPIQASNGRLAWEILLDNPQLDLLITDVAMPDMDGRDLIKSIRNHALLKELPVIIVSGRVGPNEISELLVEGASRFLPKPIDSHILADYLRILLKE